jgi:topoisomerase-4 subunit A
LSEVNDDFYPCLQVNFGGKHSTREPEMIDVDEFIGVKSHKAKGKRISTFDIKSTKFVEPLQKVLPEENLEDEPKPDHTLNEGGSASQMTLEL